jgi:hypothetical protein
MFCDLYTQPWDASYATNIGQNSTGDVYTISNVYAYTLTPQDPGKVAS